jgi:hypothetical protein
MNEQGEIMKELGEKNKVMEPNGIQEERKKALKGKYQKAELIDFRFKERAVGECSDMASGGGCSAHCGVFDKIFCTSDYVPSPAGCCSIRG